MPKKRSGRENGTARALWSIAMALVGGVVVWLAATLGWLPVRDTSPARPALPNPLSLDGHLWTAQPEPLFPIPPYARFLDGVTIVLDPGHGGRADVPNYKRGPTGLREAEVNLRVARFLREFLEAVGARVILTRDADVYLDSDIGLDLERRAAIANDARADLLLSIHHNAVPENADPEANYTTVFYHALPDHSPASLCAARHLLTGLNDALRLEQHLECALKSDFVIYDGDGFRVLRKANVPAVLNEASFHSNAQKEQRLRDPVYNRREAYGLFLGLARWAQAGLPRVALREPANGRLRPGETIVIELDDGLSRRGGWGNERVRILADSSVVKLDDRPLAFEADLPESLLRIQLPARLPRGTHRLFVDFENVFGQRVLHPRMEVTVATRP